MRFGPVAPQRRAMARSAAVLLLEVRLLDTPAREPARVVSARLLRD